MSDLLLSKIMPPQRGGDIIDRARLIKTIAGMGRHKAVLLTAPAGYGKTVAMLQAANVSSRTLVWYQLDAYDNDPAVFLRYLTAGFARQFPGFGQLVQPLISGQFDSRLRLLVTAFINELSRWETVPMLVILDDYHEITAPFVHRFLEDLLAHLPGHVQVMIASRTKPPLKLSQLKALGDIGIVTADILRFTGEELRTFLAERGSRLSGESIEMMESKVEGWPAAVKFLAGLHFVNAADFRLGRGAAEIYEYLAAEVMARQPEHMADFLMKSAVLETVTAEDCDLLLARDDSRQMLELLDRQNVFLIPLAGPGKAYRYHQLFRDFLLDCLGSSRHRWQRKAGIIARERGDLRAAVEYFRAAGATRELLAILREAARQAFNEGRWQTVVRWLGTVAEEDLVRDPWLSLYRAKNEIYQGRLDEAEKWLNRAVPLFAAIDDQTGLTESRLLQARLLRYRGRFTESIELLEQVSQQLALEKCVRIDLLLEKSSCLLYTGQLYEAEIVLTSAFETAKENDDDYAMAHLREGLAHVYWMQGDYAKALRMYHKDARRLPEWFLPSYHMQDYIAFIYLDWGEWERALDYAKRNAAIKENLGLTDALPSTYGQLASIHVSRGEWSMAEEYCKRAIELVRENNGDRIYSALNLAMWAECLGLQNRWIEAREKAAEALAEVGSNQMLAQYVCQVLGSLSFIHTGDLQQGKHLLSAALAGFERTGFQRGKYYGYAFQAWLSINEGNLTAARDYTGKVLALAANHNLLNVFLVYYEMLHPVLKLALENGFEDAFVQRILVRKGAQAVPMLAHLAKHDDPKVRLRVIAPLAEMQGEQAAVVITGLTGDTDAAVRQTAQLAAQRMGLQIPGRVLVKPEAVCLQAGMLGIFQVTAQGKVFGAISWRTAKTQDLLAYLIHKGEPVSRERVQEDLWPDMDAENAANVFHVTLHRLRQVLTKAGCPELVSYTGKRYALRLTGLASDIQQFQQLVSAWLYQNAAPEERARCLEQAAALYRGDYLEGMDYTWLLHDREKFRNLHVETRMALARYYLDIRSYSRSIVHLHRIEEEDPFNEKIHALLIKAHAGQGSRTAVIRQYQKAEAILKKELGLRPSMELHNLYLQLAK